MAGELGRLADRPLDESVSALLEFALRWSASRGPEDDVSVLAVEIG